MRKRERERDAEQSVCRVVIATSSLKAPVLPCKALCMTSALVGKGYTAAGQAGACLHTMSVLQAYQADLLKELDEGEHFYSDDITELLIQGDSKIEWGLLRLRVVLQSRKSSTKWS